jgi:hypothetical protein
MTTMTIYDDADAVVSVGAVCKSSYNFLLSFVLIPSFFFLAAMTPMVHVP